MILVLVLFTLLAEHNCEKDRQELTNSSDSNETSSTETITTTTNPCDYGNGPGCTTTTTRKTTTDFSCQDAAIRAVEGGSEYNS